MKRTSEISGLLHPIEQVWDKYLNEDCDSCQLRRLIDCFEVGLKFVALLGLSAFRPHQNINSEAMELDVAIKGWLEVPSIGHFNATLSKCEKFLSKHKIQTWSSLLRIPTEQIDCLENLRNKLAHGAALDSASARKEVDKYHSTLEEFLKSLPKIQNLRLWLTSNEEGRVAIEKSLQPADSKVKQGHLLVQQIDSKEELPLYPLIHVDMDSSVASWQFRFFNGRKNGEVSYLNYENGEVTSLPSNSDHARSMSNAYLDASKGPNRFINQIDDCTKYFVGRSEELKKICTFANSHKGRVLVVSSPQGVGKSALLAHFAKQESVLLHVFRETDVIKCSPEYVFRNLSEQAAMNLNIPIERKNKRGWEDWRNELFRILNKVETKRASTLILLDGIDEAERVEKSILDCLPKSDTLPDNSKWILSTRPELLKHEFLIGAEVLTLERLNLKDTKELLVKAGYAEDVEANPTWVDTVLSRAEGSLLYLRSIIDDLCSGQITFGQSDILPLGFSEKFSSDLKRKNCEKILTQKAKDQKLYAKDILCRLRDQEIITPEISKEWLKNEREKIETERPNYLDFLAVFAIARAPLTIADVASIFDCDATTIEEIVQMLSSYLNGTNYEQLSICHSLYRELLYSNDPEAINRASERLTGWGMRYREHKNPYARVCRRSDVRIT